MLRLQENRVGGLLILSPSDRITGDNVSELDHQISVHLDEGETVILLDLSRVSYIASSGLRVLLIHSKQLKKREGKLMLCSLQPSVRDVLEMSGFIRLFATFADRDEALAASQDTVT
ncbi:STAS domain-containing protein [Rhodovibrionaceae bacterium A322]